MKIEIPMPDRSSRKQIFDKKLNQDGIKLDVELDRFVNLTSDWNASKITNFLEVRMAKNDHVSSISLMR